MLYSMHGSLYKKCVVYFLSLNKLNNSHISVIPTAFLNLSFYSAISSVALTIPSRHLFKEGFNELIVVYKGKSLAAGVERSVLGKSDHFVNILADSLSTGLGSPDLSVSENLSDQSSDKCLTLISRATKTCLLHSMSHGKHLATVLGSV